jgi:hypothetical protein
LRSWGGRKILGCRPPCIGKDGNRMFET